MSSSKKHIGTRLVHPNLEISKGESHIPALHLTSSFKYTSVQDSIDVFEGKNEGYVYARYGNPNVSQVGKAIADLEGFDLAEDCRGLFTTNGMSAIATILQGILTVGDKMLTQGDLYGGTTELLKKVITNEVYQTDFSDLNQVEDVLKKHASIRLLYMESPTNPTCSCMDIESLVALARKYECTTVIDNTFCTPYIQRPLNHGIDFVVHSTTKYLNGHGTGLGGCIVGRVSNQHWNRIWDVMKLTGSTGSAFDAWLVQQGMKTLELRMNRHSDNALALSEFLQNHPRTTHVNYPFLPSHHTFLMAKHYMNEGGGMLSFDVDGRKNAIKVMDSLNLATQAPTLGDVDTLVLHPRTSSHLKVDPSICANFGITPGLIRVSVGIENIEDLIEDFNQALSHI